MSKETDQNKIKIIYYGPPSEDRTLKDKIQEEETGQRVVSNHWQYDGASDPDYKGEFFKWEGPTTGKEKHLNSKRFIRNRG